MSYSASTKDRLARVAPQIRPAGVEGDCNEATAAELTSSYNPNSAVTPDKIRAHHHRGPEVGASTRHWGLANDATADPNVVYGVKGTSDGGMNECLRPDLHGDRAAARLDEQRAASYQSSKARPLGHSPQPAYPVPVPKDGFGVPTEKSESAKVTMDNMRAMEELHPAGQQLDRGYDWDTKGINPTQHRFGAHSTKGESAVDTMRPQEETHLVPRVVRDYNSTTKAEIGKPKQYGFDDPSTWEQGARRQKGPEPQVSELLSTWAAGPKDREEGGNGNGNGKGKGEGAGADAHPEGDSGSGSGSGSGKRGKGPSGTISADCRGRQVVTLDELGDDATAQQLVNPCHYVSLGVQSKYFAGGRDLEGIRALCQKCEFGMTDPQINEIFAAHARGGLCGIEQFKNAATAKGYM